MGVGVPAPQDRINGFSAEFPRFPNPEPFLPEYLGSIDLNPEGIPSPESAGIARFRIGTALALPFPQVRFRLGEAHEP